MTRQGHGRRLRTVRTRAGMLYPERSDRQDTARHNTHTNPRTGFSTIGLKPGKDRPARPNWE